MRSARVMAVLALVLTAQVAVANVYTYQPSDRDLDDLEHQRAYLWGIKPDIPGDEEIVGASIFFDSIRNNDNSSNNLYVTLLDSAPLGLRTYYDNQYPTDYFAGSSWDPKVLVAHYQNLPSFSQDITYTFDAAELSALIAYDADNNIGLGFDPDCHFYNCGITFTIETTTGTEEDRIPEPVAGSILLGGIGMIIARRKRR